MFIFLLLDGQKLLQNWVDKRGNALGHDGEAIGVDGTQFRVRKETNMVSLADHLQGHDGRALEA